MPVVQLAVHAKSSTLYGRSYGRTVVRSYGRISKFFLLDGLLLFCIIMGLRSASSAIIKLVQIGIYACRPSEYLKNHTKTTAKVVLFMYLSLILNFSQFTP